MEDAQTKIPIGAPPSAAKVEFKRDEDFVSRYANNLQFESSVWDLKLIFGLLDLHDAEKPTIEQHTSISLAWPEVKICLYLIQIHLALYEKVNGKIKVPAAGIPSDVPEVIPPQFDNPKGREGIELVRKMRAEFLASLSEP
jgi:hypothetical protein